MYNREGGEVEKEEERGWCWRERETGRVLKRESCVALIFALVGVGCVSILLRLHHRENRGCNEF